MQTRKRNIDSVLNLVNPKRLKLHNADPKTGTNAHKKRNCTDGAICTPKSGKKKHVEISEKTDEQVCKPECSTCKKEVLENDKDVKKNDKPDGSHCANKPFKKRPVPDIKVSRTTSASKEVKLFHRKKVKDINTNCEGKAQTEEKIELNTDDIVGEFEDKKLNQEPSSDGIISAEGQNNEIVQKADLQDGKLNDADSHPKPIMIQVRVKKEPGVEKQQLLQKLDDASESDEFVDSGAVDDDRDEDYKVPCGESGENNVNSFVENKTKATQVDDLDRKDREEGMSENNAVKKRNQFLCKLCNKTFPTRGRLKKHTVVHTGEKPYKCEVCQMKFGLKAYLTRHMEVHLDSSEKPFACEQCPMTFARQSSLDKHKVSHQADRPFSCSVCFKKFKRKLTLTNHFKAHKNGQIYMCQYCGKCFSYRSSLDAHTKKHSEKKPFNCTECGKGFYSKQSFNDHKLRHQKIKEVECPVCKKKYYNKKELRKHMTFHSKVTEFYCKPCLMYFNDQHCLRIHTIKIHGQRYPCEFCDAKFSNVRAKNTHVFKEHRELRNARRPKMPMHEKANFRHVLCDFCGKELSNKYRLKKHLIAKHSGKKVKIVRDPNASKRSTKLYPCEMKVMCMICNKVMFNKYKLMKHMEKVHDIPLEELKNIQIVKIEGISEKETVKKGKQEQEVDVQTIVIKPVNLNSYESKGFTSEKEKYKKSTVHYLDAHGNVIYTDIERVDKGQYITYSTEANQGKTNSVTEINTNINLLSDTSVDKNLAQVKSVESVSLPSNIVDFAAQAANIIDRNKNPLIHEPDKVAYSRLSDQKKYDYTHGANNIQDITYIMEQAAGRIVAHEKAASSETVNNQTYSSGQHDVKYLVNVAENIGGVANFDLNEEGVKYIIEETVQDVLAASNPGFIDDEGNTEIDTGQILTDSSDTQQEQKIIIIDEEGVEQIITTGPSEQIKIIYDPETGFYTYIAEEVDVRQEETYTSLLQTADNQVILSDDLSFQNPAPAQDMESGNTKTAFDDSADNKVIYDRKVVDLPNTEISEQCNETDNYSQNTSRQMQVIQNAVNTPESGTVKIITFHNHERNTISPVKSVLDEIQHADTNENGSFAMAKHLIELGRDLSPAITPLKQIHPPAYPTIINTGETIKPDTNSALMGQIQTQQISGSNSSTIKSMHLTGTSCIPSLNHQPQISTCIVASSSSTFPILSSSTSYSNSLFGHSSGNTEYLNHNSQSQIQIIPNHQESVSMEQAPINESSSQMLDDISQAVLTLEHSSADVESSDFPNIVYNSNSIESRKIVTDSQIHSETMVHAEVIETHTVGNESSIDGCEQDMKNKTEASSTDICDKKDLVHLENILKTGIRDVSNTVEYTNFLDRMINHLQYAKDTVTGQHVQRNVLHENQ